MDTANLDTQLTLGGTSKDSQLLSHPVGIVREKLTASVAPVLIRYPLFSTTVLTLEDPMTGKSLTQATQSAIAVTSQVRQRPCYRGT
jgi:hypothetical protein